MASTPRTDDWDDVFGDITPDFDQDENGGATAVVWSPPVAESGTLFPSVFMACSYAGDSAPWDGLRIRRKGGVVEAADVDIVLVAPDGGEMRLPVGRLDLSRPSWESVKDITNAVAAEGGLNPPPRRRVLACTELMRSIVAGDTEPATPNPDIQDVYQRLRQRGDRRFQPMPVIEVAGHSLIFARGGSGKTMMAMAACAEWLKVSEQHGVLWLSTESDRAVDDNDRFSRLFAGHQVTTGGRMAVARGFTEVHLAWARIIRDLDALVVNDVRYVLLVIDSTTRAVNINSQVQVDQFYDFLAQLSALYREREVAITTLSVHHQSKSVGATAAQSSPTGNSAWRDRPTLVVEIRAIQMGRLMDGETVGDDANGDTPPTYFELRVDKANSLGPASDSDVAFSKERREQDDPVAYNRLYSGLALHNDGQSGDMWCTPVEPQVWHAIRCQLKRVAKDAGSRAEEKVAAAHTAAVKLADALVDLVKTRGELSPSALSKQAGASRNSVVFQTALDMATNDGRLVMNDKEKGAGKVISLPTGADRNGDA